MAEGVKNLYPAMRPIVAVSERTSSRSQRALAWLCCRAMLAMVSELMKSSPRLDQSQSMLKSPSSWSVMGSKAEGIISGTGGCRSVYIEDGIMPGPFMGMPGIE